MKRLVFHSVMQGKKIAEVQSGAILPDKVNGRVCIAVPQDNNFGQDEDERPKPCAVMEAWLEEELDALWIGVRRHGARNWDTMLVDPMLKCLQSRTSESLSERWKIERQKILGVENYQASPNAAVKRSESVSKQMAPVGDYHPANRPNGFLKIHKPRKSFGRSLITTDTETVKFRLNIHQSNPSPNKKNHLNKNSRSMKKRLYRGCNVGRGRERRDDSATELELSLREWCARKEVSSEGTISD